MGLRCGIDIASIDRIRNVVHRQGDAFLTKTFTPVELAYCLARGEESRYESLAVRFAAKEAFVKAWSQALGDTPDPLGTVDFREIEVVSDARRRPSLSLHGKVAAAFARLGPLGLHVSLTHDGPCAAAFVVLDQNPHPQAGFAPAAI